METLIDNSLNLIKYVALYIRKSRAESMEDLEKHRMTLVELCKKRGWKYVEYLEVANSDSIDMRPEFKKLLKEIEDGIYDAVCVVEYDRLGRGDLGDQDRIKKAFQKSETYIVTPDKTFNLNDDNDETYADLKGFFARQEYKMIKKRLRQGKKVGSRRGQWTNGTPPFPYVYQQYMNQYNDKGLVVHEERFKVYREMVEMALDNIPPGKIAIHLNQLGLRTVRGCNWSGITVQRILIDETHLGKIISNKTIGDGHKNKNPNAKPAEMIPRNEWIVVENCHVAIKTQQEHDKIIELIGNRRTISHKSRHQSYAFTGLIECEQCGHFHSFHMRGANTNLPYMRACHHQSATGEQCHNAGIRMSEFEEMVLNKISEYKQNFIVGNNENDSELEKLKTLIAQQEEAIIKQKRAISIINDAYELGDYTREEWLERKKKRDIEIHMLEDSLYELTKRINSFKQLSDMERLEALTNFFEHITSTTTQSERNELYRTIIKRIIWYRKGDDKRLEIEFK